MDILKYIVCLIIAAIIYFIVGLIAWNIVCSWVDMSSCTLVEISNGIKEQIDTITNRYNKWLYLFHISSC